MDTLTLASPLQDSLNSSLWEHCRSTSATSLLFKPLSPGRHATALSFSPPTLPSDSFPTAMDGCSSLGHVFEICRSCISSSLAAYIPIPLLLLLSVSRCPLLRSSSHPSPPFSPLISATFPIPPARRSSSCLFISVFVLSFPSDPVLLPHSLISALPV